MMDTELHEQYEYALKRIQQKKNLYLHFVVFLIANLFMFIANHFFQVGAPIQWFIWVLTFWLFFLILHFIKVYLTDRFMNKNWEREQIDRLIAKQKQKINQLEIKIEKDLN